MDMKISLRDFTFLIPLRADSIERVENLMLVIQYLLQHFDTNIKVLQSNAYDNGMIHKLLNKRVEYTFIEDKDPIFYKTKYQNILTNLSTTPFIGTIDADIIIPKLQIIEAVDHLRCGNDIVYPYDGRVYETTDSIRELYLIERRIGILEQNQHKMPLMYGNQIKGGAMFVNKDAYIKGGMENEKFYGWGDEDFERYYRWHILQYKVHCCSGYMFHLSHSRGINSIFRSSTQLNSSKRILLQTRQSSKTELLKSVNNKYTRQN